MQQLLYLLGSFFTCCLIWAGIVASQIGKPDLKTQSISEIYEKKETYANSINEPKLIIVSGSNALFGINSEKLESTWQTKVVNTAVTEGFGMKYILDRSKKVLSTGDIALLPLEYSFYQKESELTEHYANFILSHDTDYFYSRSLLEKIIIFARVELSWALTGLMNNPRHKQNTETDVYGVHNINQRGDQINNSVERSETNQIIFDNILPQKYESPKLSQHFIDNMNNYIQWAKESGICLIIMPPTYLYFDNYQDENFIGLHRNIRHYYDDQDVPFMGDFFEYMYTDDFYYNSRYHLNILGGEKRTIKIIEDIGTNPRTHCI